MGGTNDTNNIVKLTGREHFVAHQLLVKIYPNNHGLVNAANMMCTAKAGMQRSQNRRYEWLRTKLSAMQKLRQSGKGNSNYGKIWISNSELRLNKKITMDQLSNFEQEGWKKGRIIKWNTESITVSCKYCQTLYASKIKSLFCSVECKKLSRGYAFAGREKELIKHYQNFGSINKAVKEMGLPGAMGAWYYQAKKIIDEVR